MATAGNARPGTGMGSTKSPAQMFALVFGAVYLILGIAGFIVTGFDDFATATNEKVLLFPVNPLHNIVHLGVGAMWLASAGKHEAAKSTNMLIGVVYLLVALLGFFGILDFLNIEGAGSADNFLHLVSGALSVLFATAMAEGTGATRGTTTV